MIVAVFCGAGVANRRLLNGIFLAFLTHAIVVFLFALREDAIGIHGLSAAAFYGFAGSKNAVGDMAAIGAVIACAVLPIAVAERRIVQAFAAAAMFVAECLIVYVAHSTGAMVAALIGSILVIAWTVSRLLPLAVRTTLLIVGIVGSIAAALTRHVWLDPIFKDLLHVAGKDTTLTGRTFIWSRAEVMIDKHPMLGIGFGGYWRVGQLEPEAIWRKMNIGSRTGYNFHNTPLDIVVNLGYVGLALFAAVFVVYLITLLMKALARPTQVGILFSAICLYELSRMNFETVAYGVYHHGTILLYAGLAWAAHARMEAGNSQKVALGQPLRGYRTREDRLGGLRSV